MVGGREDGQGYEAVQGVEEGWECRIIYHQPDVMNMRFGLTAEAAQLNQGVDVPTHARSPFVDTFAAAGT